MKKLLLLLTLISRFAFGQGSISTEYNSTTKKSYLKTGVFPKANVITYTDTSVNKSPVWWFNTGRIKFKNSIVVIDTSDFDGVLVSKGDSLLLADKNLIVIGATNGLTLSSGFAKIGGTLTDSTVINLNNRSFVLKTNSADVNKEVIKITDESDNIALIVNQSGNNVIALGKNAGSGTISAEDCNFLGENAGSGATNALFSNFMGKNAGLNSTTATHSNFFGQGAGSSAPLAGGSNFLGANAGAGATNAVNSNFLGQSAGNNAVNANGSNFLGYESGNGASNANGSNFLGNFSGSNSTNANNSNFFGFVSGRNATNAYFSNFFGPGSGDAAINANNSNFFGAYTGLNSTNASNSNFFGKYAGRNAINAANSIFIGTETGDSSVNLANSIVVGKYSGRKETLNTTTGGTSIQIGNNTNSGGFKNTMILGDSATSTAENQLYIASKYKKIALSGVEYTLPTGQGVSNSFLKNNGSGVLSWDTVSGGGGTTTNPVTFNNSGSGDASGTTFNGSAARTISYNSVGAAPATTGTSLLKANGSGGFSDADSTSVYNAIGSKPANRFIASPSTTSGNATARYISQPDLNYLYERIGVVISDNFSGTFSTNWSTTGSATATNSGGKMSITGTSTKSLGNYFLWKTYSDNNKTCATNTTSSFDVDIPASTTTSFGVGFRLGGTSLNIQSCILLNNASRGKLVFYFNGDTSTAITSNAALSVTTGDVVTLKLTRTRNTFTLTARIKSGTNVNQEISHILNIENNNSTTYRTPNAGAVGINSLGGNFTLDNFSYSIDDTKYNKVLVLGNSIASGSRSNSQSQTFPARLGDLIGSSININSGGGNLISDINATESLLYQDQIIVIELGTNDLLAGTSAATIKLKLDTLIGKLSGYTTSNNKLFILSLLPNNTVDVTATNTLLASSYGSAFIDITKPFANTSGTGINSYYSPDGTHPTSEGAYFIADCIFQKINPYLNISYNHRAYDNPVYRVNGNTSLGNYDQIPNFACDIFKSNYTKQFRIGYTESGNDGLTAWSTVSRSHAVLAGGMYAIATTAYASDTANNRLSFNNGDIKLSANGGLTIGNTVTPTNRLQYTKSSNTWEQINSYAVFGGNNATTSGNTIYRQTNAGSALNALVMFENGVTTGAGATSSGFGTGGGYQCYIGNTDSKKINIANFSFGGTSTAGSEDGYFLISTKSAATGTLEAMRLNASQNVGIGTGSNIVHKLDVWSTTAGSGIRNYNSATLASNSGGLFLGHSPFATGANQRQATFGGGGYDGTNAFASARMQVFSSQAQSFGSAYGGYLTFETNPTGTITLLERMRIDQNGNVGIGVTAPTSYLHIASSTTAKASLTINSGTKPTSPIAGDIWNNSSTNALEARVNGIDLTLGAVVGKTTLVAGTKAITITGLTTGGKAIVTRNSQGGTITTTVVYEAVCTANTLTINAEVAAGTVNTSDTSVISYVVYP